MGRVQNPARLVGGESGAGAGFDAGDGETRVVLAFPDSYEVGISNQAMQILYHLARGIPRVGVERVYLPWVDAIAELRLRRHPSHDSRDVDAGPERTSAWASRSSTNSTTPTCSSCWTCRAYAVRSADRGESDPLVVAGGPATAGFWPVARFVDAFVLGDGEEVFVEVVEAVRDGREAGLSRAGSEDAAGRPCRGVRARGERDGG